MARGMRGFLAAALVVLLILVVPPAGGMRRGERLSASTPDALPRAQVLEAYGHLPLSFEANRGQTDPQVTFLARDLGYTLFLTAQEMVFVLTSPKSQRNESIRDLSIRAPRRGDLPPLRTTVLRMRLVGGNPQVQVEALEALPGKVNYFIGNDPTKWRTSIPTFARIRYRAVYPGVDVEYYGRRGGLEYDLRVAPGGDARAIRLGFEGVDRVEVDRQGDLVLHVAGGQIRQGKPRVYQEAGGVRQEVAGRYRLRGPHEVGMQVGAYDSRRPLVIDPVLSYSTYLGGSLSAGGGVGEDRGFSIAVDRAGNAYVTGFTTSINFPVTPGPFQTTPGGGEDAFVTKLNATGSALVYSTYLGGNSNDEGKGIAVDGVGSAYVTGFTYSTNFPTTPGAFQTAFGTKSVPNTNDVFVTKLNATGSALVYSTYLGGNSSDEGIGIAVDGTGNAYVTGFTYSTNFPTTPGAFQTSSGGGADTFATKLDTTGSVLLYSTYLGGSGGDFGNGIAVDGAGNAYVTGVTTSSTFPVTVGAFQTAFGTKSTSTNFDVFVAKVNTAASGASSLVYSTYLGGSDNDFGNGIAVDGAGNAYVTGFTSSPNFPISLGAFQTAIGGGEDAFVAKLNATGSALVYSTYLGGSGTDEGDAVAVDGAGNAYVTGSTSSPNFPTANAVQPAHGGNITAFVTKLNPTGSALMYSTYLGGSSTDVGSAIAVTRGSAYVTGFTSSPNFPITPGAFQTTIGPGFHAFIARLTPAVKVGLYNPATSVWFLRNSNTTGIADLTFAYGPAGAGWLPVVGNWAGPGPSTVGLYDPLTSVWFLRTSNTSGFSDLAFAYGPAGAGWLPVVGDWTGKGVKTVGLYNPATSAWFLRNSNASGIADLTFAYGPAGARWTPLVGDWTGKGYDSVGLYNPTTSTFFLRNSNTSGIADLTFGYGPAGTGWTPVVGDWTGKGYDSVGLYNPATSTFFLRNSNTSGIADLTFAYGPAGVGWLPVAGDWDGL